MKVYAMVQKGTREGKLNCDDRALVGNTVLDQGYYELETENANIVIAVSDGVGGRQAGWKAASITLESMRCLTDTPVFAREELENMLAIVNDELRLQSQKNEAWSGMAATLSLARIMGEDMKLIQLGDSRIYSLQELQNIPMLRQITTDHNNLERWLKDPMLKRMGATEEDLKQREGWNSITSYMGMDTELLRERVDIIEEIDAKGLLILTSDGVHDFVERDVFRRILLEDDEPKNKMKKLMAVARENGSDDDQTIILAYL